MSPRGVSPSQDPAPQVSEPKELLLAGFLEAGRDGGGGSGSGCRSWQHIIKWEAEGSLVVS